MPYIFIMTTWWHLDLLH